MIGRISKMYAYKVFPIQCGPRTPGNSTTPPSGPGGSPGGVARFLLLRVLEFLSFSFGFRGKVVRVNFQTRRLDYWLEMSASRCWTPLTP